MNKENPFFGQSDVVPLSDEDAAVALLERAVTGLWGHIAKNRETWLAAQRVK